MQVVCIGVNWWLVLGAVSFVKDDDVDAICSAAKSFISKDLEQPYVSSSGLRDICKSLLMLYYNKIAFSTDLHFELLKAARKVGLAYPEPIMVADSNWSGSYFGFVLNPGSRDLEFWRLDYTGSKGEPMNRWRHWLDGSRLHPHWGVFTSPGQYQF